MRLTLLFLVAAVPALAQTASPMTQSGEVVSRGGLTTGYTQSLTMDGTGSECPPVGQPCTTAVGISQDIHFAVPGQNIPLNRAVNCNANGDCLDEIYFRCAGGTRHMNAEGQCGVNWSFLETASPRFTVGESGLGLTTIHPSPAEFGVGRYLIGSPAGTGTVINGTDKGANPFAGAQLQGGAHVDQTVSSAVEAATGFGPGTNVSVQVSTAPKYKTSAALMANCPANSLIAVAEPGNPGGPYYELTSLVASKKGVLTLRSVRIQHLAGAILSCGGMVGYGIEQTANTAVGQGALQVWPIIQSLDTGGHVLYASGPEGPLVATLGTTAWSATNNRANVYPLAQILNAQQDGNTRFTLTLSANAIQWATGRTYTEPNGLTPRMWGFAINDEGKTPSPDHNALLRLRRSGWAVSHPTDRLVDLMIGQSFTGSVPEAFIETHGTASNILSAEKGTGTGFWLKDYDCNAASVSCSFNLFNAVSGGRVTYSDINRIHDFTFLSDTAHLPGGAVFGDHMQGQAQPHATLIHVAVTGTLTGTNASFSGPVSTPQLSLGGVPIVQSATAPTGSCSQLAWNLSNDGHISFCNGRVWAAKL